MTATQPRGRIPSDSLLLTFTQDLVPRTKLPYVARTGRSHTEARGRRTQNFEPGTPREEASTVPFPTGCLGDLRCRSLVE